MKNYIREATLEEIRVEEAKGMLVYVSHKKQFMSKSLVKPNKSKRRKLCP